MSREDHQMKIRLPADLKEKIDESAKAYKRSLNADIIARLEHSFLMEPELSPLKMPESELLQKISKLAIIFENLDIEQLKEDYQPPEISIIDADAVPKNKKDA